jgi:uncharacterized protein (DUF58 family)
VAVILVALATGYHELLVLAVVGMALLGFGFLVPRASSAIGLERHDVARFVQRGDAAHVTLYATSSGVVPPVRIIDQLGAARVAVDLPSVTPTSPAVARYRIPAHRRGVQYMGPMLEERVDPFGLVVRSTEHQVLDEVWVHPVIHALRVPVGEAGFRQRAQALTRPSDDPLAEFRSLRDYVPGDDPRLIHWVGTARTGTLVVRDHLELRRSIRYVVLETLDSVVTQPEFEEAVEIAASICVESLRSGLLCVARTRDAHAAGSPEVLTDQQAVLDLFTRVRRTPSADTLTANRLNPIGYLPDQVFVVTGSTSPVIGSFGMSPRLRSRLSVVRVSQRSDLPRLPVRSTDVRSALDLVAQWQGVSR